MEPTDSKDRRQLVSPEDGGPAPIAGFDEDDDVGARGTRDPEVAAAIGASLRRVLDPGREPAKAQSAPEERRPEPRRFLPSMRRVSTTPHRSAGRPSDAPEPSPGPPAPRRTAPAGKSASMRTKSAAAEAARRTRQFFGAKSNEVKPGTRPALSVALRKHVRAVELLVDRSVSAATRPTRLI